MLNYFTFIPKKKELGFLKMLNKTDIVDVYLTRNNLYITTKEMKNTKGNAVSKNLVPASATYEINIPINSELFEKPIHFMANSKKFLTALFIQKRVCVETNLCDVFINSRFIIDSFDDKQFVPTTLFNQNPVEYFVSDTIIQKLRKIYNQKTGDKLDRFIVAGVKDSNEYSDIDYYVAANQHYVVLERLTTRPREVEKDSNRSYCCVEPRLSDCIREIIMYIPDQRLYKYTNGIEIFAQYVDSSISAYDCSRIGVLRAFSKIYAQSYEENIKEGILVNRLSLIDAISSIKETDNNLPKLEIKVENNNLVLRCARNTTNVPIINSIVPEFNLNLINYDYFLSLLKANDAPNVYLVAYSKDMIVLLSNNNYMALLMSYRDSIKFNTIS